jgi:hypothetical protein
MSSDTPLTDAFADGLLVRGMREKDFDQAAINRATFEHARHLERQLSALRAERDEARQIVANVNNSVFGSQGYFTTPDCVSAVADLKRQCNAAEQRCATLTADLEHDARVLAELNRQLQSLTEENARLAQRVAQAQQNEPGMVSILTNLLDRAYKMLVMAVPSMRVAEQNADHNDPLIAWASDVRSVLYRNKPVPGLNDLRALPPSQGEE